MSVEGIEASGKSTLVAGLSARLRAAGHDVVATREPGGTRAGDAMRALFLDPDTTIEPLSEVLLLNASRAQLLAEVIRPALAAGRWVITDRFSLATFAYQGYGRGLDLEMLRRITDVATGSLEPDRILLVDVPIEVSRARVRARAAATGTGVDRLEREGAAFHERVREGYRALASSDARAVILDGTVPAEALLEDAWRRLSEAPV